MGQPIVAFGLFTEDLFRGGSGGSVLNHRIDFQFQNICPFGCVHGEGSQVIGFDQVPPKR